MNETTGDEAQHGSGPSANASDGPSAATSRWLERRDVPRGGDYDRRFTDLAATGVDVHGEADLVASFGPTSVLDAGCGTGRVAIELARRGIDVVGVDLDPGMLETARAKAPALEWVQGDLATLDLARTFDVVVMAGNVLLFVAPGTEARVVERCARHLVVGGLLIAGFSLRRDGLDPRALDDMVDAFGLALSKRWSTWARTPFREGDEYAVSVYRRGTIAPGNEDVRLRPI